MGSLGQESPSITTVLLEISSVLLTPLSTLNLEESFVKNGGNSLTAVHLHSALRQQQLFFHLPSLFEAKTILQFSEHVIEQWDRKRILMAHSYPSPSDSALVGCETVNKHSYGLAQYQAKGKSCSPLMGNLEGNHEYLALELQQEFINSSKADPSRNMIAYFETHLAQNVPQLQSAWKAAMEAEEIFSLVFEPRYDKKGTSAYYMRKKPHMPFQWTEHLYHDADAYTDHLNSVATSCTSSDTASGRFEVVTLASHGGKDGPAKSTIIWLVHHALIDATSFSILRSKVAQILQGKPVLPSPSFLKFCRVINCIREQQHSNAVEYWAMKRQHLGEIPRSMPLLPTPVSQSRVRIQTHNSISVAYNSKRIRDFAASINVPTSAIYYAAWSLVLMRYTSSSDVCFGVVLAGRPQLEEDCQSVIGPTINNLPFIISLEAYSPESDVKDLCHGCLETLLELMSFQWSVPSDGFSRDFASVINICPETLDFKNGRFDPIERPRYAVQSDFPLQLDINESAGYIEIAFNDTALFEVDVGRLGDALETTLTAITNHGAPISTCLDAVIGATQGELARLGHWELATTRESAIDEDESLVSLFTASATLFSNQVAVQCGLGNLTYRELDEQSTTVARQLLPWTSVGDVICVEANVSFGWITAIYGVLKAGAVYCPMLPDVPDSVRIANFTTSGAVGFMGSEQSAKALHLVRVNAKREPEFFTKPGAVFHPRFTGGTTPIISSTSPAYLCFTSGSSGKPKGVLCRHKGIVAFQKDFDVRLKARAGWKIGQFVSPGFDGSIHEIFSALSYGATLVLKDAASGPFEVLKNCDAAILTPSIAQILEPEDYPKLKALYLVGESVSDRVCNAWAATVDKREVYNMYGPTEFTCGATIKRLAAGEKVTLGTPNPSSRIYILDHDQRLVPLGVEGEIYLAGIQVAVGYINQPEITYEKFLRDTINPLCGNERMYRTGDRGYWNHDGQLVFEGRNDRQIKLKGFRIDLDDLGTRMAASADECKGVVVTSVAKEMGLDHLVAAVRPAHLDITKFAKAVRQRIPFYSLPKYLLAMDNFPTTKVGKVDYKQISNLVTESKSAVSALCQDLDATQSGRARAEKGSTHECIILETIRQVLGFSSDVYIDLDSSLRENGVDSVSALHISSRLSWKLHFHIAIYEVLKPVSIRSLANHLATMQTNSTLLSSSRSDKPAQALGRAYASPMETEWWQKYQLGSPEGTAAFNVTYLCSLDSAVDIEKLTSAWNKVLKRHDILRSEFPRLSANGLERQLARQFPNVTRVADRDFDVQQLVNTPFKPAIYASEDVKQHLIRVFISPNKMLVVVSHIICDSKTLSVLLGEVALLYSDSQLMPCGRSYFHTERELPAEQQQLEFWQNYLKRDRGKVTRARKVRRTWSGSSYTYEISQRLCQKLRCFAAAENVTMHQIALSAVSIVLQLDEDPQKPCDITFGAPFLGRRRDEDMEVVGLFVQPLPIRIRYPLSSTENDDLQWSESIGAENCSAFLAAVQLSSEAALCNALPWDQLQKCVEDCEGSTKNDDSLSITSSIFDVMVSFHEKKDTPHFDLPGTRFIPTRATGAKFNLMVELTTMEDDSLELRLEYSDECYTEERAALIARWIETAFRLLLDCQDYAVVLAQLRVETACSR